MNIEKLFNNLNIGRGVPRELERSKPAAAGHRHRNYKLIGQMFADSRLRRRLTPPTLFQATVFSGLGGNTKTYVVVLVVRIVVVAVGRSEVVVIATTKCTKDTKDTKKLGLGAKHTL